MSGKPLKHRFSSKTSKGTSVSLAIAPISPACSARPIFLYFHHTTRAVARRQFVKRWHTDFRSSALMQAALQKSFATELTRLYFGLGTLTACSPNCELHLVPQPRCARWPTKRGSAYWSSRPIGWLTSISPSSQSFHRDRSDRARRATRRPVTRAQNRLPMTGSSVRCTTARSVTRATVIDAALISVVSESRCSVEWMFG